ncbi:hypothetical protein BDW22DRAFT_1217354 [Trametopsis cervina]|nr:hypothetical protein BDW22DRAFT_1217354 [Trametopsis cervina]
MRVLLLDANEPASHQRRAPSAAVRPNAQTLLSALHVHTAPNQPRRQNCSSFYQDVCQDLVNLIIIRLKLLCQQLVLDTLEDDFCHFYFCLRVASPFAVVERTAALSQTSRPRRPSQHRTGYVTCGHQKTKHTLGRALHPHTASLSSYEPLTHFKYFQSAETPTSTTILHLRGRVKLVGE